MVPFLERGTDSQQDTFDLRQNGIIAIWYFEKILSLILKRDLKI